jgi:GNAT superfamily N-acetyltransferase
MPATEAFRIETVRPELIADLEQLFGTDRVVDDCWCMWWLIRVADYHRAGHEGNRAALCELIEDPDSAPVGVIGYEGDRPVGWCAVGPRRRYARLIKTPTLRGRDPDEDDDVWFMPCFFVRSDARGRGLTHALVAGAVAVAREHGARAIEAFPYADDKRRSSRAAMGVQRQFEAAGFAVIRRPSDARVIMRLDLDPRG